jgi:tetratricopeptide (TPR) repeat protein
MCVKPFTPEYENCLNELAAATRQLGSGKAPAITWMIRGGCLQNLRDLAGATRDYTRAVERGAELTSAELAQVYDSRNVTRRQLKEYRGAVADGVQAVALAPAKARYHTNLGYARIWLGEFDKALADLNRALEIDPEEYWAIGYRALCYLWMQQYAQALEDYNYLLAISTNPSHSLLVNRARCYIGLEHFEQAISDCHHAAHHTEQEDPDVYRVRGYAEWKQGDLSAALGDFSRAIGLKKDLADAYLWRGLVLRELGDEIAAQENLSEFVRLYPKGPLAAVQLMAEAVANSPAMLMTSAA